MRLLNVSGPSAGTTIERYQMRSRATSFLMGSLILPTALALVSFISGCSDESHTTGTTVTLPPGAEEARKSSMEKMKEIMKNQPKQRR